MSGVLTYMGDYCLSGSLSIFNQEKCLCMFVKLLHLMYSVPSFVGYAQGILR